MRSRCLSLQLRLTAEGKRHGRGVSKMQESQEKKPQRMLSMPMVIERIPLSAATIYRMVKRGEFPEPRRISPGRKGWPESQIDAWIAGKPYDAVEVK